MIRAGLLGVAIGLAGCSGTFSEARMAGAPEAAISIDPPECAAIDGARRDWGAVAKGTAVAAGASGISAIPVQGVEARWAIVSAGVVVGIFSAISQAEADSFAASWVRQCGATSIGRP
jgi:hypothetical protein